MELAGIRSPLIFLREQYIGNPAYLKRVRHHWSGTAAGLKKPLDGLNKELNSIAMQHMDDEVTRRGVRSAFIDVQRNLDHPLFKIFATENIQTEEWYIRNSRGIEIFCKSWKPERGIQVKGALGICHGYGDTCTFFFEGIAQNIAASGYCVYALDHPCFGLSEGLHGYIHHFNELSDNVIEIFSKIKERPELRGLPFFLLGQSMGGAVALKSHLKQPDAWDGMILVAPMCKIAESVMPPEFVLKVFTFMSKLLPKAKLFPQKDLTELVLRDPEKRKIADYNVIGYNDQMRLRTAVELIAATKEIESQVENVSSPLLIIHGAADKVTDPQVSKFLYERASSYDKSIKLYEDGYHCLLEGEPDDRIFTVLNDIVAWLDSRSLQLKKT